MNIFIFMIIFACVHIFMFILKLGLSFTTIIAEPLHRYTLNKMQT